MDKCADYLLKCKEFLRYHEYLRDGLPIATVIEAACGRTSPHAPRYPLRTPIRTTSSVL